VQLPREPGLARAAWSVDGRLLATGDADGTVTVWRASDGLELERIATPAPVAVLAFTRHALLAASGGHVRIVRDPGANASVRTIRVNGAVVAAALSPDGSLVAVAVKRAGRNTAEILDAHTGRRGAVLRERGIGSLGFSADGRLLVTGSTDKTARLWAARTGRLLHVLPQRGHVVAEQFSPDGRELVTSSADGSAAVWNVRTGIRRLLLVGATGVAEAAAYSPDGKEIAVAFGDRIARIYSSDDGRLLAPLAGHTDAVTSVGFDPGGALIVTGSNDGTVRLWSAGAGDQLRTIDREPGSVLARFAGGEVLTVAGSTAHLRRADGRLLERERMPAPIVAVATHGTSFALADRAGNLLRRSVPGTSMAGGFGVTALAYAPDGTLVAGSRDGTIRLFAPGGRLVRRIRGAQPIAELSAADGRFAARTLGGTVRVYGSDGRLLQTLPAHAQLATIAPNGAVVATATAREADLWDIATGKLVHRLRGHRALVRDAEFSPDSAILVTASDDHDARTWDVATGGLLHVLRGHFFPVRTASFSADGRWIVTASQFTAGLWDARTGRLVLYLQGHTRPLTGAMFSPAGDTIVTGSEDGTARLVVCDICRNLAGLQQLARERLRRIR
jgi:WD40 repeat protein